MPPMSPESDAGAIRTEECQVRSNKTTHNTNSATIISDPTLL
jgi:hypothetical protein